MSRTRDPSSRTGCDWHSDSKKVEVVTTYLVLGKAPLVEMATGVPAGTIRRWKMEPWWKELVEQIQSDDDQELDGKLAKRINKVMDILDDRMQNGDFIYDARKGSFVRKPVSMKETWVVGKDMIDVRTMIRKQKPEAMNQEAVADILKSLATEFATMARKKVKGVPIGPELQAGVPEVSRDSQAEEEQSTAEQSPQDANARGQGQSG
jgi:hypothetical protein